eukprot:5472734-Prymnesium_polylepis.1
MCVPCSALCVRGTRKHGNGASPSRSDHPLAYPRRRAAARRAGGARPRFSPRRHRPHPTRPGPGARIGSRQAQAKWQ